MDILWVPIFSQPVPPPQRAFVAKDQPNRRGADGLAAARERLKRVSKKPVLRQRRRRGSGQAYD